MVTTILTERLVGESNLLASFLSDTYLRRVIGEAIGVPLSHEALVARPYGLPVRIGGHAKHPVAAREVGWRIEWHEWDNYHGKRIGGKFPDKIQDGSTGLSSS